MDHLTAFTQGTKDCKEYYEALEIVKKNSSGKIWIIGGFVFRTIVNQIYGLPMPPTDLDFIVQKARTKFELPSGWNVIHNRFGNPKLVKDERQIDYVPLDNIYSIKKRDLEPTIENFLSGCPLNIQSLAFDVYDNKLIGERGLDAIQKRVVEVADLEFANYAARKKGKSLKDYIQEKADDLGFRAILPLN